MGNTYLLDCTLRDGGYINDWQFGEETIKGFSKKIAQTGIEYYEVGFLKGESFNPNVSVFPDTDCVESMIAPKNKDLIYLGMLDMSAPLSKDKVRPRKASSIDGIRVIFKKDKIDEAYEYCKYIKEQGYMLFVNLVGTDNYSDKEFIDTIEKFNELDPVGVAIVDSFGLIKRKQFLRLVYLADNNLKKNIALCYHAHNNLQQAFGNAEALVEMNLKRDVVIDACVFGMGRGAGNLNLELFAEYMNENYDTHYQIEPMLEIMDEYLNDIYKNRFWGYSLPLYISANTGCHPNYAIYLAEKDSLTVKSFNELLRSIPAEDKGRFSKERAEKYYREYLENYIDDKETLKDLSEQFAGKDIIILAPGGSIRENKEKILAEANQENVITIALNFLAEDFEPDYIFSGNMRRYVSIQGKTNARCITTSNMRNVEKTDYVVNFSSCMSQEASIVDNSGLMLMRLLVSLGVKNVKLAGMDGYQADAGNYYNNQLEYNFSSKLAERNISIEQELKKISKNLKISFITPTVYKI